MTESKNPTVVAIKGFSKKYLNDPPAKTLNFVGGSTKRAPYFRFLI